MMEDMYKYRDILIPLSNSHNNGERFSIDHPYEKKLVIKNRHLEDYMIYILRNMSFVIFDFVLSSWSSIYRSPKVAFGSR